jgi:hypothetical protein
MCRVTRCKEGQTGSLRAWNMENEHTNEILLTSFIIFPIPDLCPAGTRARNNWLENVAPHSDLDNIQTTIPPLIAERNFEVCISRGLSFLGPISISVPGTSQFDQGSSMPTMHRPVKDDKVRSLCLHQDVSRDRPATRGLQSIPVTVL